VRSQLTVAADVRNGPDRGVRELTELVAEMPAALPTSSFGPRWNATQAEPETTMTTDQQATRDNDLVTREPLRIAFALIALVLGLIAALH
jgi:hypothetical protein